ncbi:MAG: TolC family protein [Bacteroidales bacterium]|jgi:outer membrane protein TolC
MKGNKNKMRVHIRVKLSLILILINISFSVYSQDNHKSDTIPSFALGQCIDYAMQHQPALNQSLINLTVTKINNRINLSGWLPQLNLSGNLLYYNQLPTTFIPNQANPAGPPVETHNGMSNTFIPALSASQTLFNPQLVYAAKRAPLYIRQAEQVTDSVKINIVSTVSKSFYNLLLTLEQINVLKEDTARLGRSVRDAYHQYVGGIVDVTDYEQAIITLNNSKAQLKQQTENAVPSYAALKQSMGCPPQEQFNIAFDTSLMMQEITFDTTQLLQYEKRIEYQQLQTLKNLQHQLIDYNKLSFLPTVSAIYNYYYEYESNTSSALFNTAYPYSYMGLTFNFPIFTGFSRTENLRKSKLQEQIVDWDVSRLKSQIYTEYTSALAAYKSNLYNLSLLNDNENHAKNVYRIVSLQYMQGIVPYLNIIVAESNLITAEIGHINALFQLMSSKIDLEKAIGVISFNH